MDPKDVFGATPNSTWQVLCAGGVGFYIPPYQREYNWSKDNIDRLFEDIVHGLQSLVKKVDSLTFLGTLLVMDNAPVLNADTDQLPANVRLVIDGQQRLTTILLININLHDEIRRRRSKLKLEKEACEWLNYKAIEAENRLQKTFEVDMDWPVDEDSRWYPSIIRAYEDQWSRFKEEAKYKSPLAAFVHGYSKHIRGDDSKQLYKGENGSNEKTNKVLTNYGVVRGQLRELLVLNEDNQELGMLSLEDASKNHNNFQETIMNAKFPKEVCSILSDEGNEDFKQLIGLVLFANFLMDRVTVTVVSTKNEDYAFDMFESLNTTGEPLTAFETFRPKVIETEGISDYERSPSRKLMKPIEDYLGEFKKADDRHTETSRFLTPFALAETGYKLPKRHSDQRGYLRVQYDNKSLPEERHKFLEHMSHTAIFIEDTWKKGDKTFKSITFSEKNEVLTCMDLLGKVSHEVTIGALVRFYSQVKLSSPEDLEKNVSELEKAIKTVTAFFALWRGCGKTTGDLATQYKELLEKGFDEIGIQAFCRCPTNGEPYNILTADKLQKALRYVLNNRAGIKSKEEWVTRLIEEPVYKDRKNLTRFLLFAAMHNTTEDNEKPGLRSPGREGTLDMLIWDKWSEDLEIEHVASQTKPSQIDSAEDQITPEEDLYGKPNLLDCLGNLTLLPKSENISFGNSPWPIKKEMFYILSAPSTEEQKTRLTEVMNRQIAVPDTTQKLILEGKYYRHLSAIYKAPNWNVKFVQKRSKRLAELVWKKIAPWLGLEDE